MPSVYSFITQINSDETAIYVFIIFIFVALLKSKTIGLNLLFALFLSYLVILYLIGKKQSKLDQNLDEYQLKTNYLKDNIATNNIDVNGNQDLIDFLFSIQDIKQYHPSAYQEMTEAIKWIIEYVDILKNNVKFPIYYYQIMVAKKETSLNALHSIIFTLPDDGNYINKLDKAHQKLEKILNQYLDIVYGIIKKDKDTEVIHTPFANSPKANNHYDDRLHTYQYY